MRTGILWELRKGVIYKRAALALLGIGVFVLATRSLGPSSSVAAPGTPGAGAVLTPPGVLGRKLGELHGQDYRLEVHAGPNGPLYTIISPDGVTLAKGLTEAEVVRDFPGLQIDTMTADTPDDGFGERDW